MSWVGLAISGGSAILNYMGSQNTADQASNAANAANAQQAYQFNQTQRNMAPWLQAGGGAINQLAYLMGIPGYQSGGTSSATPKRTLEEIIAGLGGNGFAEQAINAAKAQQMYNDPSNWTTGNAGSSGSAGGMGGFGSLARNFGAADFQQDPGYAFRLAEGQKALERSAAAKGMSLSGAQAKALTNYNQNFASNEYSNAYGRYNNDQTNLFNRLSGIAGTGQQANQFMGQLGANYANQLGQNTMGAASVGANATMNGYGGFQNAANQWMNYNNWNQMMNQNNGGWGQAGPWGTGGAWMSPIGSGPKD